MKKSHTLPYGLSVREQHKEIKRRLDLLAKETMFFLDPDASLDQVSETIGTNRTYVSRMINKTKRCTFSTYVNSLRLDYAMQLLSNKKYLATIKSSRLLSDCGFSSPTTFRRAFHKRYGVTPASFISDLKAKMADKQETQQKEPADK